MTTANHISGFVNVNGIRLHYLDWGGSGPALIFLTGMGSSAYIYNRFAPRFTDKFRVLGLTRRGHGDSDYPDTGYDADTLVEDIRQSFEDIPNCHVIGTIIIRLEFEISASKILMKILVNQEKEFRA